MKALLLSFDKGEELRPITITIPKGLLPVRNVPILERNILRLREAGITEIGVITDYLGHKIKTYFEDGSSLGVSLSYFSVKSGLKSILDSFSDEALVVVEGEWLNDASIKNMLQYEGETVVCGKEGEGGVYFISHEFFPMFKNHVSFRDAILDLNPVVLEWSGECNRIRNHDEYLKANQGFGVIMGRDCMISETAILTGDVVIGNGVTIDDGAIIKNSVLMDNAHVGKDCEVDNAVISRGVLLKTGTFVFDLGVIGEGAKIGCHSFIKAGGQVLPYKSVGDDTTVGGTNNQSAFYGTISIENGEIQGSIFGEITAELSVGIGKTLSYLNKGSFIGIGYDGKEQSKPLYLACLSGLMSSGGQISDYEIIEYPSFYSGIMNEDSAMNIYISTEKGESSFFFTGRKGEVLTLEKEQNFMRALKQNLGGELNGIRYKMFKKTVNYIEKLKERALKTDISINVKCVNKFAHEALCMYYKSADADICFCLNERMDKMNIEDLSDREMQILYSIILTDEKNEDIKRMTGDGIFSVILVLNYMEENHLNKQDLLKKISGICVVKREINISSCKRAEKREFKKDGGKVCVTLSPVYKKAEIVAEGYNEEYAEDLADYYVRKILEDME